MKNQFVKYYIATFYFCSTFMMFALPGDNNEDGDLEGGEAPIDDYIWLLAIVGLVFMFNKYRNQHAKKMI